MFANLTYNVWKKPTVSGICFSSTAWRSTSESYLLIIIVSMKSDLEERSEPSLAPFTQNINSFSSRSNQVLRSTHLIRKTSQQKRRLKTNEETVEDVKDLLWN
jgi:hypothetical protein